MIIMLVAWYCNMYKNTTFLQLRIFIIDTIISYFTVLHTLFNYSEECSLGPFCALKEGIWSVECFYAPNSFPAQVSAYHDKNNSW